MKNLYILLFLLFFLESSLHCQSIRKNYREMADHEKVDFVNALYQLRLGPDLFNDLAQFHLNFSNFDGTPTPTARDIHNNLPDEAERDIFLAWHRSQMLEVEHAMQEINPNISLPFVDWDIDNSINAPLWDFDFMGQFDVDWNLGRTFGQVSGTLPTARNVQNLINNNVEWLLFSNQLERGVVHVGPHGWIGGAMTTGASPRDPVFYLHHTGVDKVWEEWQKVYGYDKASFITTNTMLRYDGTYMFDGVTLPVVNPNDIVNSNESLGIFYAENQLAILEGYEISNNSQSLENFYYQYTIEVGNNFMIPTTKNAKIESNNEILLKPGFEAASGSSFTAKIDNLLLKSTNKIIRNQKPFDNSVELTNIFLDNENSISVLRSFPNPFTDKFNIQLAGKVDQIEVVIYNLMGQPVKQKLYKGINNIEINDLNSLSNGIYIIKVINMKDKKTLMTRKLVK